MKERLAPAALPPGQRIYAVGDVHGCLDQLEAMHRAIAADLAAPALVLVTHHVEEIPPHFTDVLLLREGRIVAQGPLEITLTEANLEATFGLPLELERRGQRWAARAKDTP